MNSFTISTIPNLGDAVILLSLLKYHGLHELFISEPHNNPGLIKELAAVYEYDLNIIDAPGKRNSPNLHNLWKLTDRSLIEYKSALQTRDYYVSQTISTDTPRCCSEEEVRQFTGNTKVVFLDNMKHKPLLSLYETVSASKGFIGIDSGWSWSAISCGIPTRVLTKFSGSAHRSHMNQTKIKDKCLEITVI